jgi:hypothetical protein
MSLCSTCKPGISRIAGLLALACGLLISACATTGKDYATVYVNDAAGFYDFFLAGYPPYRDLYRLYQDQPAAPSSLEEARQYTEYLRTVAKAADAAKASPHVIAVDLRRSLSAYAKGVAAALPADTTTIFRGLPLYKSYARSVLIGECINIAPEGTGTPYTVTFRVDHAGSPALPDVFDQYEIFKIRSNIRAEGNRIPFETGASYIIYADTLEVMDSGETKNEIGLNTWTDTRQTYDIIAFIHGIDDFDRQEIYKRSGGELPRDLQDTSLPARLLSTSPYQKAGGIDFDMGTITGADRTFEVLAREALKDYPAYEPSHEGAALQIWSNEALRYAPFIKLDASGADGVAKALSSEAGFLWKKWIALAQTAQSTLRVLTTNRLQAIPYFVENPQIFGGRAFTEAEYRDGARVCMVSDTLAARNGLNIGDTLPLAFFNNGYIHGYDPSGQPDSPSLQPLSYSMSGAEPDSQAAYTIIGFFPAPPFPLTFNPREGSTVAYTPFDIDANTVIVPDASIKKEYPAPQAAFITDPDTGKQLIPVTRYYLPERCGLLSVVLKPGAFDAFRAEMEKQRLNGATEIFNQSGVWNFWNGYSVEGVLK